MRYNLSEIAHAVWLPISSGLLTAGVTWLVWFFSTAHCTPANAAMLMCEVTPLGRYLTSAALSDCVIHAGIVMTLTGGSDVMLFLQERRRNAAVNAALTEQVKTTQEALQRAEEALQRAEQRNEEALQRAEEARLRAERRSEEERQRTEEVRQHAEQRMTEQHQAMMEQRQAMMEQHQAMMEQHQAMMALTAKLSDTTDRDRNGHTPPQS